MDLSGGLSTVDGCISAWVVLREAVAQGRQFGRPALKASKTRK